MSDIVTNKAVTNFSSDSNDNLELNNDGFNEWPEDAWGAEAPLPLHSIVSEIPDYPTDCLGELANVVRHLAKGLQVAEALAAQTILSAISIAAQNHANVQTHLGATCPLALFMLTVTDPGSRKEVLRRHVFLAIKNHEINLKTLTKDKIQQLESTGDKISDQEIADLYSKCTYVIDNASLDFVAAAIAGNSNSLIYTGNDITQFVGVSSAKRKSVNAQGYYLSQLWDNFSIQIKNGRKTIYASDCYLSLVVSINSDTSDQIIDTKLFNSAQDMFSKFLITYPKNCVGTRLDVGFDPTSVPELAEFHDRVTSLLSKYSGIDGSEAKSSALKILKMDADAESAFIKYVGDVERYSSEDGYYQSIVNFALRAPEHILKLAGLMAIYENPEANNLNINIISRAIYLFDYYTSEYMRISEICHKTEELSKTQRLLTWLEKSASEQMCYTFRKRWILQHIHLEFRTKAVLDKHLKTLEDHKWITVFSNNRFVQLRSKPGVRFIPSPVNDLS